MPDMIIDHNGERLTAQPMSVADGCVHCVFATNMDNCPQFGSPIEPRANLLCLGHNNAYKTELFFIKREPIPSLPAYELITVFSAEPDHAEFYSTRAEATMRHKFQITVGNPAICIGDEVFLLKSRTPVKMANSDYKHKLSGLAKLTADERRALGV